MRQLRLASFEENKLKSMVDTSLKTKQGKLGQTRHLINYKLLS